MSSPSRAPSGLLAAAVASALAAVTLAACTPERPGPAPVGQDRATDLVLGDLPFAELSVPPNSRPHGAPPDRIPLGGTWRYTGTSRQGMHKWATDIPIRPRGLFFHRAQPGMSLEAYGAALAYDRFGRSEDPMWVHDRREIVLYLPEKGNGPRNDVYTLVYPKATERERGLNLEWSGSAGHPEAFAWTTIQDDWDSRRGLLLPAPGTAAWDLTVPEGGEFRFASGLVEPEIKDGPPSDGATLVVEVEADGAVTKVFTGPLAARAFTDRRVDLTPWAGRAIRLRVRTEPGADPTFDYAFLAEPVVASRREDGVRVVLVFIDTLRPDHMSLYGYTRDTTAALDDLAKDAVVFEQARSIAPWTLPSARTIVTGRQPEMYAEATTIQEVLRHRGFATAFFAGNVYLSNNFDMTRDWDFHRVGLWPQAAETTDDALAWLDAHEGRNALIQVHYMSTHLPYVEPAEYRRRYAGDTPENLREEFHLSDVRKAKVEKDAVAQQYIRDRYDNNVRYATDQVRRIVDRLDANDVLLLFADHGEEFWDHQGFEHGHSLYDELLRVPLVVRAPGLRPGRVTTPVSLLDVAPTVLELAGAPIPPETEGRSLVALMRGDDAGDAFAARPQAFGRPLYGKDRWGVLTGTTKWTTHEGREQVFDLADDAEERKNLLRNNPSFDVAPSRRGLGQALGRAVLAGYRLVASPPRGGADDAGLWALCTIPGGFSAAWKAEDPLENSDATVSVLPDAESARARLLAFGFEDHPVADGDGAVEVCWHPGYPESREIYLGPTKPLIEVGGDLRCSVWSGGRGGGQAGTLSVPDDRDPGFGADRTALAKVHLDQRRLSLELGIAPIPDGRGAAVSGRDDETNEMLEAMGYTDRKDEGEGDGADSGARAPSAAKCEPRAKP